MIPGREWVTNVRNPSLIDLQFACTFELPSPHDCTSAEYENSCDCPTTPGATWLLADLPPVCGGPQASNPADQVLPQTKQVRAKAYPTIRETELVKMMGTQGVLASICPKVTIDNATHNDPNYGYRPAVAALVDRLKGVLAAACLPEKLTLQMDGTYPCNVLEVLPNADDTCKKENLASASAVEAEKFVAQLQAGESADIVGVAGKDIALNAICVVPALTTTSNPAAFGTGDDATTCKASTTPGWYYVSGAAAGGVCEQEVQFTKTGVIPGAQVNLQCLENSLDEADARAD